MRGGALPPGLLFAALGLAIGSAPRRAWTWSLIILGATLAAFSLATVPRAWLEMAFVGCWASAALTAATVYLARGPGPLGALVLAVNAGVWSSTVVAVSGSRLDLLKAIPCILIFLPASWLIERRAAIAVKVASSWLIAIAILVMALPFLPVTPGYLPDHLE